MSGRQRKHPIVAFYWAVFIFIFITLPQWFNSVWGLVQEKPFFKYLREDMGIPLPSLSPYFITLPLGLAMFGILIWALLRGETKEEKTEKTKSMAQRTEGDFSPAIGSIVGSVSQIGNNTIIHQAEGVDPLLAQRQKEFDDNVATLTSREKTILYHIVINGKMLPGEEDQYVKIEIAEKNLLVVINEKTPFIRYKVAGHYEINPNMKGLLEKWADEYYKVIEANHKRKMLKTLASFISEGRSIKEGLERIPPIHVFSVSAEKWARKVEVYLQSHRLLGSNYAARFSTDCIIARYHRKDNSTTLEDISKMVEVLLKFMNELEP